MVAQREICSVAIMPPRGDFRTKKGQLLCSLKEGLAVKKSKRNVLLRLYAVQQGSSLTYSLGDVEVEENFVDDTDDQSGDRGNHQEET